MRWNKGFFFLLLLSLLLLFFFYICTSKIDDVEIDLKIFTFGMLFFFFKLPD